MHSYREKTQLTFNIGGQWTGLLDWPLTPNWTTKSTALTVEIGADTSSIGMQILMIPKQLALSPIAPHKMSLVSSMLSRSPALTFVFWLRWVTILVTWLIQLADLVGIPTFQNTAPKNLNLQPDISLHSAWGGVWGGDYRAWNPDSLGYCRLWYSI